MPWTLNYVQYSLPRATNSLSAVSEVWKNIFVLAHEFCIQVLFIEIYQIPINPGSSQLWRSLIRVLSPFWEGHPTPDGKITESKKLPPSFSSMRPQLDPGRHLVSSLLSFLCPYSDWYWEVSVYFRKSLFGPGHTQTGSCLLKGQVGGMLSAVCNQHVRKRLWDPSGIWSAGPIWLENQVSQTRAGRWKRTNQN